MGPIPFLQFREYLTQETDVERIVVSGHATILAPG
jgi:hypothetical protein